ncbi:hypothetical protein F4803DRAFT_557334 [Xylaria telfairii]|nr:hypothetical protein F4803DRAFT_557334 [Xylaria telfairii]
MRALRSGPRMLLGFHSILYRPSSQNRTAVVTISTAHQRHFSASGVESKYIREKPRWNRRRRYQWVSPPLPDSDDVCRVLESYMLDPDPRKRTPDILNPHNPEYDPEYQAPPSPDKDSPDDPHPRKRYRALAINCHRVAMSNNEEGLLNIAVIDFFTGDLVLNSLVRPSDPVTNWRRHVTGYNRPMLNEQIKRGKVLSGWKQVREKIFNVTACETIFIGHGLVDDLPALRIATDRVIDSNTIMCRAVFGDAKTSPYHWDLKTACRELLDVAVYKTRARRDPLQGALATRELVLQYVLNPEILDEWAARTRGPARIEEKDQANEE